MDTVFYSALTTAQLDKIEAAVRWIDSQFETLTGKPQERWHVVDLSSYDKATAETIKCLAYPGTVRYLADDYIQGVKVFAIPFRLLYKLRYIEALYRINKEKSYVRDASVRFCVSVKDLPDRLICAEHGAVQVLRRVLSSKHSYTEPAKFTLVN